jgi:DNA-binding transcriptional LysR family regulator
MDHRLIKFLAVAEAGSFSEAAAQLHVSQPAITLAVAALERSYGVKLHVRKKYSVELTPQGEMVARTAKKIAAEMDKLQAELAHESAREHYQVGIIDSIARLLYGAAQESQTLRDVEVMVDNSRRIINDLLAAKIDAGLITGQSIALNKRLSVRKLRDEAFVFVCTPHRVPSGSASQIDDWLAFNKDSTSFKHFTGQFNKMGLTVTPIFYSTSMELLEEMAVAGKGTALLPRHIVQTSVKDGKLAIIQTGPLNRPIWAVARRGAQPAVMDNIVTRLNRALADVS